MVPRVRDVVETATLERDRFSRFCRSLTDDELGRIVPGSTWRVKDFINHVATLDGPYAGWFTALIDGDTGDPHRGTPDFDVDEFNEGAVTARRDRSMDEMLDEAERGRATLIAAFDRLTDAQLDATIRFGGDRKRPPRHLPLGQFLQGWVRHDAIHAADMLKALPERRFDQAVVSWLEDDAVAPAVRAYQQAMG